MSIKANKDWFEVLDKYLKFEGPMVVVGAMDTGKSCFCQWICNELVSRGRTVAFIDADVGQSDISPCTCISLALFNRIPLNFSPFTARRLYFIGSTTPVGHLLQGITGVSKMLELAQSLRASCIIINTTGWINSGAAIAYKHSKLDIIGAGFIVAFEINKELSLILKPYRKMNYKILRLPVSKYVEIREREQRREIREKRLEQYFSNSVLIALRIDTVGVSGVKIPPVLEVVKNQIISLDEKTGLGLALGLVTNFYSREKLIEILTPFKGDPKLIKRLRFKDYYK